MDQHIFEYELEGLSRFERHVLYALAVVYEACTVTDLQKVLRSAQVPLDTGRVASTQGVSTAMDKLVEAKLTLRPEGRHVCRNPELVLPIASRDRFFSDIRNSVRLSRPWRNSVERCRREVALAIYTGEGGDIANVAECYEAFSQTTPQLMLASLCGKPFSASALHRLPSRLKVTALHEVFGHALSAMDPLPEDAVTAAEAILMDPAMTAHSGRLRGLLAEAMLARGLPKVAMRFLEPISTDLLAAHWLGWTAFLRGDDGAASTAFDLAAQHRLSTSQSQLVPMVERAGLFYALHLLRLGTRQAHKQLGGFLQAVLSGPLSQRLCQDYRLLQAALCLQQGDEEGARKVAFPPHYLRASYGNTSLLNHLIAFWLDGDIPKDDVERLQQLAGDAHKNGYRWIAMEALEILARLPDFSDADRCRAAAAQIRATTGMTSIVGLGRAVPPWQPILEGLERLVAPPPPPMPRQEPSKRLVWAIEFMPAAHAFQVEPREQVLKNGVWSKGRALALSRLHELSVPDYVTSDDRSVIWKSKMESGSYGKISYYFPYSYDVARALAGHPRLVLAAAPEVPVEIVKASIELIAEEDGDHDRLRLSRDVNDAKSLVEQEGPAHFRVFDVTENVKAINAIIGPKGLRLPRDQRQRLLGVLSGLAGRITVHAGISGQLNGTSEIAANAIPHILLSPSGAGLKVSLRMRPFAGAGPYVIPGQGGERMIAELAGVSTETQRDLAEELHRAQHLLDRCEVLAGHDTRSWQWHVTEPLAGLELISTLDELSASGEAVVAWPDGKPLRIIGRACEGQLWLRVERDGDWFSTDGALVVDSTTKLELQRLLELLDTSPGRFVELGQGEFLALTEAFARRLREFAASCDRRRAGSLRMHPHVLSGVRELLEGANTSASDAAFRAHLAQLDAALALAPKVPELLDAELREYQVQGFEWLTRLAAMGCGACLADDMGIGKTIQALALILDRARLGPQLVVAPASVTYNWLAECGRFAPSLRLILLESGQNRGERLQGLGPNDLVIASYGILVSDSEALTTVAWTTTVLDEAQAIKNAETQRARAAFALRSDFKMALTGTPVENHVGELWSLFEFLTPGLLGPRGLFAERFVVPIEQRQDREAKKRLKRLLKPFILRRTKGEVLTELPPRIEINLLVHLSSEEAAMHEALRLRALEALSRQVAGDGLPSRIAVFAELMRLRRAACDPSLVLPEAGISGAKQAQFRELITTMIEGGHKALVFSQFVDHLALARQTLADLKIPYQYLDGATLASERARRVERFQAGEGDVFLISLRAGGTGLNLTAADYVIHLDPWWNPAVEAQAESRAHRLGQTRPVTVYHLIGRGTVEEKILAMHARKRDLAAMVLDDTAHTGKLSVADLIDLIRDGDYTLADSMAGEWRRRVRGEDSANHGAGLSSKDVF